MENTSNQNESDLDTYSVNSPVLLVAFNRPEETSKVISRLRTVKPRRIYFAVDGPRSDRIGEDLLVKEVRDLVSALDWNCTVLTRFLDENLGCGLGVSSAISWALESEEYVIILEDDIVPVVSFFRYCDQLLEYYKNDSDIFSISGCNFVPEEVISSSDSYRLSSLPNIWGWAVWKRSWEAYSFDMRNWRDELPIGELRVSLGGSFIATFLFSRMFDLIAAKKIDTWDYQVLFAVFKTKSWVVSPNVNLTENIGFGANATHTVIAPNYILETNEIEFPIRHPSKQESIESDKWTLSHAHGANVKSVGKNAIRYMFKRLRMRIIRLVQ